MITFENLLPNAQEVLGQLFVFGPQWDGHLASKVGRDILVEYGLVVRGAGWQWLTEAGVKMAVGGSPTTIPADWFEGRWRKKASCS